MNRRYSLNPELSTQFAECDGGIPVMTDSGVTAAVRGLFRGRLSGISYEEGDPPWRWYELVELSLKPDWHPHDSVWCEEGFLFIDQPSATSALQPEASE
jgi:hypothetical protein